MDQQDMSLFADLVKGNSDAGEQPETPAPPDPAASNYGTGTAGDNSGYSKLEWAQHNARYGLIFPLGRHVKTPFPGLQWKQFATRSKEAIDRIWGDLYRDCNIGVWLCCGVSVIDLDVKNEVDGITTWHELCRSQGVEPPVTLTVETASGGRHLYFQDSDSIVTDTNSKLGPGIDTKGRAGMVVGAGSTIGGRAYKVVCDAPIAELPAFVIEWFKKRAEGKIERGPAPENIDDAWAIEYATREIESGMGWTPPTIGNRNHTAFNRACRLWELGVPEADALRLLTEFLSHGHMPDEGTEHFINRVYHCGAAQNAFGSALPPRHDHSGATMMGGASSLPPGDPSDGPVDLWPQSAPEPKLTPDMLPDAPALRYGFNVARRQGVQAYFAIMAMLVTYAALIHDAIRIQRKPGHLERAHLSVTCIDEVGAGKSPTARAMLAPVYTLQARLADLHKSKLTQYGLAKKIWDKQVQKFVSEHQTPAAGTLERMTEEFTTPEPQKPYQKQYIVEDATIEAMRDVALGNDGGLLNFQDEMSGWLQSFDCYRDGGKGGKDQSFWTKTDDGGSQTVNRVGQSWHLENVGCSHFNFIQPDKLRPLVKTLVGDGFLQRNFAVYGGEEIEEDFDLAVDEEAKAAHERLVEALAALDPNTVNGGKPIIVDANINEPWGMRLEVETIIKALRALPSTPGHLKNHLKKYRGKVYRLLLLYHVIECVSRGEPVAPYVSFATAERVKRFVLGFLLPNAIKFYNDFFQGTDGVASDAIWIAGHILARGLNDVTLSALRRATDDKMGEREIRAAMAFLQTMRWVGPAIEIPAKRSTSWDVDPRVHTIYAERGASERVRRDAAIEKIREAAATCNRWAAGA